MATTIFPVPFEGVFTSAYPDKSCGSPVKAFVECLQGQKSGTTCCIPSSLYLAFDTLALLGYCYLMSLPQMISTLSNADQVSACLAYARLVSADIQCLASKFLSVDNQHLLPEN